MTCLQTNAHHDGWLTWPLEIMCANLVLPSIGFIDCAHGGCSPWISVTMCPDQAPPAIGIHCVVQCSLTMMAILAFSSSLSTKLHRTWMAPPFMKGKRSSRNPFSMTEVTGKTARSMRQADTRSSGGFDDRLP